MGQYRLKADPNSTNLAAVEALVSDFNSRPGGDSATSSTGTLYTRALWIT